MSWARWREAIVVLALGASLGLNAVTIHKVKADEGHTRLVQMQGAPTGVCLREAARAALPILVDGASALEAGEAKAPATARAQIELFVRLARSVEAPLAEYVRLQDARYRGVVCPGGRR